MSGRLVGGLVYLAVILAGAIYCVRPSILTAIALPIILSILAPVTDEGAQSGAMNFRGKEAWQRMCVNVHWALLTFYLSVTRGILVPTASGNVKDVALIFALLSLLTGLSGAYLIRKFNKYGALMASISLPIAVGFAAAISRYVLPT